MNELARRLPGLSSRAVRSLSGAWGWGVELRLWVATCVAGLTLFCAHCLDLTDGASTENSTRLAVLVTFFSTLALYNLDGTLDCPRGVSDASPLRRRLHMGLTALSFAVLAGLTLELSVRAFWLVLLGALLCGLYAMPISLRGASTRLKSLPHVKGPFVGSAVATAAVWVPLWSAGISFDSRALPLTAVLALYCTANAVLFDVPDVGVDAKNGVPTVPTRSGMTSTKRFCALLSLTGALLSFAAPHTGALLALGGALLFATRQVSAATTKRAVAWWVDGALLLPLLALWVTR